MQWPWPRWVLAIEIPVGQMQADADGAGLLTGIEMNETRNVAGGEFEMDPILELPDQAHLSIGTQKVVATQLHGRSSRCGSYVRQ